MKKDVNRYIVWLDSCGSVGRVIMYKSALIQELHSSPGIIVFSCGLALFLSKYYNNLGLASQ